MNAREVSRLCERLVGVDSEWLMPIAVLEVRGIGESELPVVAGILRSQTHHIQHCTLMHLAELNLDTCSRILREC